MKISFYNTLFLHFDLFDIHCVLPLLIQSLKLEFKPQLQLLFMQRHRVVEVNLTIIGSIIIDEVSLHHNFLSFLYPPQQIHLNNVHLGESLKDLPEEIVTEGVIGLHIKLLQEVILQLLVLFVELGVPA
jgi:hypothetical protein